jgi:hypothetical protein
MLDSILHPFLLLLLSELKMPMNPIRRLKGQAGLNVANELTFRWHAQRAIDHSSGLTSSPSLLNLGAETYAKLKMRSCEGLVTCDSTTVSPDRTDLTRASKGILNQSNTTATHN